MYRILFTSALSNEGKIIKKEVKKIKNSEIEVSFFEHGMGNYNTILNLTKHLSEYSYDFIVNIGVCGHIGNENEKYIQVARSENILTGKEIIFPIMLKYGTLRSIACSEKPVFEEELLGENKYVDMESYGFEKVCESFKIGRISLKVPVDRIGQETKNFDVKKAQEFLEKNIDYLDLIEKIKKYCENIPKKINLNNYLEHYQFTFSEKIIFEKLFHKYISLFPGEDFDNFFQKHSHVSKKNFLEVLKNKGESYII